MSQGSSKIWLIVLGIVAGGMLMCCGGGFMLFNFGMGVIAEETKIRFANDPVVAEHLGEIKEWDVNFTSSIAETDEENDDEMTMVYDVVGTKANAQLVVTSDENDRTISAVLKLNDGQRIELNLEADNVAEMPLE